VAVSQAHPRARWKLTAEYKNNNAWYVRYIFILMEKRNSHEEIDYGAGRCHKRLEYVK
jgi:hypothetical protein